MDNTTPTRRQFGRHLLNLGTGVAMGGLFGCGGSEAADDEGPLAPLAQAQAVAVRPAVPGTMPDEGMPHKRTWMAFGASASIWGNALLPVARANLGLIARTIAQFEPVTVLVRSSEQALAASACGPSVGQLVSTMDDLWMRDTGPVFVKDASGSRRGLNFNFNGWGGKQTSRQDRLVSAAVAKAAGVPLTATSLVLEGGGIEVDGHGTAIITESCVLNRNRNPGWTKAAVEAQLKTLLGLKTIIWLPGIVGKDITDGHTDFYARFAAPGVVIAHMDNDPASYDNAVTKRHLAILKTARDARGQLLKVVVLNAPTSVRPGLASNDFAAGYVNFYVCNDAVIAPQFGDAKADADARSALLELFPTREVVQLNIDGIAAGGGGIHCTTQQEPA
ncbi:agmatine deiminase family protein [Sphaerotilus sp.]|uniref:agmatine deiminase family protein n=1 Tax=Sphaerotilus sp. TaxID=2093942 RepID=UPI00286E6B32|nr:agmatine deiminase family protein [Sphaerotilus sp.]